MAPKRFVPVLLLFWPVLAGSASAQEFSHDEMEVWQAIEECSDIYATENMDNWMGCYHDDFSGWLYGDPVPRHKSYGRTFDAIWFANNESIAFHIRPIDIRLHGDVAIAHYSYTSVYSNKASEEITETGRWTDILVRDNGRWVWLADHGGPDPHQ